MIKTKDFSTMTKEERRAAVKVLISKAEKEYEFASNASFSAKQEMILEEDSGIFNGRYWKIFNDLYEEKLKRYEYLKNMRKKLK